MLTLSRSAARDALVSHACAQLKLWGWDVTPERQMDIDFLATNRDLRFRFACLDGGILKYYGQADVFERIRQVISDYGRKGMSVVYIVSFPMGGRAASTFIKEGMAVFPLTELSFFRDIAEVVDQTSSFDNPIYSFMFSLQPDACIRIAKKRSKDGDLDGAIGWARVAATATTKVAPAYTNLVDFLILRGDLDEAESIAMRSMKFEQNNLYILTALQKIAIQRGDSNQASQYELRIHKVKETPTTLNDILAKQRVVTATAPAPSVSDAEPVAQHKWWRKLFKV